MKLKMKPILKTKMEIENNISRNKKRKEWNLEVEAAKLKFFLKIIIPGYTTFNSNYFKKYWVGFFKEYYYDYLIVFYFLRSCSTCIFCTV